MGWRYKAGLFLIAAVVIIWVTSAEVTQDIFAYYKQPFAVTYLGASLLVVYLPVAFLKDWTCNLLKRQTSKSGNDAASVNGSSDELSSPLSRKIFEIELQGTLTKKDSELDLASTEEGKPLVSRHKDDLNALKHDKELTTREIAVCGFYIAPIWFVTEAGVIYELCAAFRSLEVRHFDLLPEKGFEADLDAIAALADQNSEVLC